jgi:hypothetical protein
MADFRQGIADFRQGMAGFRQGMADFRQGICPLRICFVLKTSALQKKRRLLKKKCSNPYRFYSNSYYLYGVF